MKKIVVYLILMGLLLSVSCAQDTESEPQTGMVAKAPRQPISNTYVARQQRVLPVPSLDTHSSQQISNTDVDIDSWCSLNIRFHSPRFYTPGELVITDPLGRKEGYDPISNTPYYGQIPKASYGEIGLPNLPWDPPEPQSKDIDIPVPAEGEYELKVIGTEAGVYDLEIDAHDREGGRSYKDIEQIPISPNTVHTYILNYSREAGSKLEVVGGFDGKGQRPRDVNKFLSYSNPTQVTTELLPGVKTFNLSIFYDQAIITGTFKAELNRQDITRLFSPLPGGNEVVKLNLVSGRNTLVLSVDGRLSSGRQATDTDRLVFIVP